MAYIGKTPVVGNFQVCDAISVVNGQAAYTMQISSADVEPESANHMLVSLNGILQKPGSSYTISGATITFASNLATGDSIDFIMLLGNVLDIGTPSDATVTHHQRRVQQRRKIKHIDDDYRAFKQTQPVGPNAHDGARHRTHMMELVIDDDYRAFKQPVGPRHRTTTRSSHHHDGSEQNGDCARNSWKT